LGRPTIMNNGCYFLNIVINFQVKFKRKKINYGNDVLLDILLVCGD
jgi:hypothetical protein